MKKRKAICLKIRFYLISLSVLFGLIAFMTSDIPISFDPDAKFIGCGELFRRNIVSIVFLILTIITIVLIVKIKYEWAGVTKPPYEIESIQNESYEYLTFLTTYIIPLVCIDLDKIKNIILLLVLLGLIGYIFVRMNLYYGNPALALLGYKLYRCKIKNLDVPSDVIVISKDDLTIGSSIEWISIDEFVWIAKENKNDRSGTQN